VNFFYFQIIQSLGPVAAISVTFTEPFFAMILAYLFLKEPLKNNFFVGGFFVLLGSFLVLKIFRFQHFQSAFSFQKK